MYDPPGYLWALTIAGIVAIPAATCIVLYGGALRAGQSRARAALLGGGAAVVFGGWFTASAVIAAHGWYHAQLGRQVPWLPIVVAGFLGLLLALRRIPAVARALAAPGMDEPAGASALVPGDRGNGLRPHDGPRPSARAVRPARGPG